MIRCRAAALAIAVALAWPAPAAAWPPYRVHPEYAARAAAVRTVGVVAPDVRAYDVLRGAVFRNLEVTPGAVLVRRDWAEQVRGNLLVALEAALRRRQLAVRRIDPTSAPARAELRDVRLLYEAIGNAVVEASFENDFPAAKARLDHSVGDVAALLGAEGVDAAVFTCAVTFNGTGGELPDRVFVGMVDRSGALVWFSHDQSTMSDLRDPESAALFVKNLLDPLPPLPRRTR